jgi:outer membrane lipoprotein-sorting protein
MKKKTLSSYLGMGNPWMKLFSLLCCNNIGPRGSKGGDTLSVRTVGWSVWLRMFQKECRGIFGHRPCFVSILAGALLMIFSGQSAHAYILRGPHLLELLTRQYGNPGSLMVVQKVLFYEAASGKVLTEADETLRYVFPNVFRSDSISPNASRVHLVSGEKTLTVIDEKIVANDETLFDLYKDILLYRSRESLGKKLTAAGIDTTLTCMGRFQDRIAVVLGSEKSDEQVSQVWVDKETFQPIRWVLVDDSIDTPGADLEIRYDDWRQVKHTWYPMHVAIYKGGGMVREIRVQAVRVGPSFPKGLMDVESLQMKYLQSMPKQLDPSVDGELNEIEKTINEFRKRIEE